MGIGVSAIGRQKGRKTVFPRGFSPPFLQNDAIVEEVGRLSREQVPSCLQWRWQHWIYLVLSFISGWKGLGHEQRYLLEGWRAASPFFLGAAVFQPERQMWLHRAE